MSYSMNYSLFDPILSSFLNDSSAKNQTFPLRADILETDKDYSLHFEMAGVKKENVSISYHDGYLTVTAKKQSKYNDKQSALRLERSFGEAKRSFYFDDIEESAIDAAMEDGVLTVILPKIKPEIKQPKQIAIH